jgi:outer membrane autotransporter protein
LNDVTIHTLGTADSTSRYEVTGNTTGSTAYGLRVYGDTGAYSGWAITGASSHITGSNVTIVSAYSAIQTTCLVNASVVADAPSTVTLTDSSVTVTGTVESLIVMTSNACDTGLVTINGGTLTSPTAMLKFTGSNNTPVAVFNGVDMIHTGGIEISGSAANLQASVTINDGSGLHGNVLNQGANNSLTIGLNRSAIFGDVIGNGSSITYVNLDHSILNGDITANGQAVITVNLDNHSVLTGKIDPVDLTIANGSNWNLTAKSSLHTLTGADGSISIANVQGDDLIVSDGISGNTKLYLGGVAAGTKEIRVIQDESNAMNNDAFTLGNTMKAGMYTYGLDNRSDGAWLVLGAGNGGGISDSGNAVLNSAGAVSGFWFTQLDNLNKRMGELRYNAPSKGEWLDNVWIRSYGQQANINTGISGVKGFSETQYGVDLGTDKAWSLDKNNTLYTGIFAGYGGADRDFHTGYNGNTDSGYGGLYGTWINKDGWYADAVAKGQYFRNDFDGEDRAKYDSVGVGLSLELGRQFQFADGWFAEPSVQISYLHLMNDNYSTDHGMAVNLNDSDVVQFYGGARLGRNIKLNQSGWLQPYVKVGVIEQISSGGQVKASGGEWRPTTDGARGVIGAGVVYQLDDSNQLHLDYEAAFGDKYDKPWGLNFGYRHQF